jgi:hypothetical protein
MTTIEMRLVKQTVNFVLYKAPATEEKDSFGEIYISKRDLPFPYPDQITVTVGGSIEMALWAETERIKR